MAITQAISTSGRAQAIRVIPSQGSPRSEVVEMFKTALALAHDQVIIGGDTAGCASCRALSATGDELAHSPDCAAGRALKAHSALKSKVSRKPATSATVLSPISAA